MLNNYAIGATAISTFVGYTSTITSNTTLTSSYLNNIAYFYTDRRINIDLSTGYKIPYVYFLYTEGISQKFYLYGSNNPTSYNETNVNNRKTDSNAVFLGQVTPSSGTEMYIYI